MTSITIFGIKNCDTMKKAFKWLDENGVTYSFHDYKKDGADRDVLERAIAEHGWENVVNRRGTTWRKLDDDVKASMNAESAVSAATESPSMIKRPLLVSGNRILIGFDEDIYHQVLS